MNVRASSSCIRLLGPTRARWQHSSTYWLSSRRQIFTISLIKYQQPFWRIRLRAGDGARYQPHNWWIILFRVRSRLVIIDRPVLYCYYYKWVCVPIADCFHTFCTVRHLPNQTVLVKLQYFIRLFLPEIPSVSGLICHLRPEVKSIYLFVVFHTFATRGLIYYLPELSPFGNKLCIHSTVDFNKSIACHTRASATCACVYSECDILQWNILDVCGVSMCELQRRSKWILLKIYFIILIYEPHMNALRSTAKRHITSFTIHLVVTHRAHVPREATAYHTMMSLARTLCFRCDRQRCDFGANTKRPQVHK